VVRVNLDVDIRAGVALPKHVSDEPLAVSDGTFLGQPCHGAATYRNHSRWKDGENFSTLEKDGKVPSWYPRSV
jgi:hypothetical protein